MLNIERELFESKKKLKMITTSKYLSSHKIHWLTKKTHYRSINSLTFNLK